jgi:SAM-dependent methyltransferase
MWAVLTGPEKRHGKWDADAFFATGPVDVERIFTRLDEHHICVLQRRALDFGCGMGRLTFALGHRFEEAVGVDIAVPMVDAAMGYAAARSIQNCRFHVNVTENLSLFSSDHFDLIVTNQVLQHLPRSLGRAYIHEFARILAPNGVLVMHLPTRRTRKFGGVRASARNIGVRLRQAITGRPGMEMHAWSPELVRRTLADAGMRVVTEDHARQGPDWFSATYFAVLR